MGNLLPTPSQSNPTPATITSTMTFSNPPPSSHPKPEVPESATQNPESSDPGQNSEEIQENPSADSERLIKEREVSHMPTPSQPNPTPVTTTSTMNSSNPPPSSHPKPEVPESATPNPESSDPPTGQNSEEIEENLSADSEGLIREGDCDREDEEEEEGECGFCLFMKAGGCKDTFIDWEKCVEEGEKKDEDIVEKCFQVTAALKNCMEAHSDYYSPLLQAEKAAQKEAVKQLEEENKS